jgi:hypothetical protein
VGVPPPEHAVFGDVHVVLLQHAWLRPPQVPQPPFEHVPPRPGHVLPLPVQTLLTQQPPPEHVLPAQHAWPAPPHAVQMPLPPPVQASPAEHERPAQQTWPAPPHA